MEIFHSLERHCYGDACYCDLRLSIYDCVGSNVARVVNIINIALSALLTVVGFTLVYHRIVIKGYTFIDSNPKKGLLRPKPIDCMLLFITIFNSIRLVCSIILVLDVAADNMTFRSFIYEWGFQWGLTGFTLYLIGIAQTLAESHKAISDSWLPSPFIVDAIGISIIFASHVGNTILAVGAGIMARSNIKAAEIFVQVNYIVWFVLTASVAFSVLYCGSRLLKTLKSHIKRFNTSNERYLNIKNGIFKIRVMMGLIVFCLLAFSVSVFVYGILRNTVIKNYIGSVILCVSWNMLGPLTVVFIQVSIIFNPIPNNQSKGLKLKSSGEEKSTTLYEIHKSSKFDSSMHFKEAINHVALDDLSIKYEDFFKKTSGKPDYYGSPSLDTDFHTKKRKELTMEDHEDFEIQRSGSRIHLIHT